MMLLQGLSLILTWSYALIFWLLVGAFLPPRVGWPLKLAGFSSLWLAGRRDHLSRRMAQRRFYNGGIFRVSAAFSSRQSD